MVSDEALTCALEALRDGRTGTLSFTYNSGGVSSSYGTLQMLGDGTAYLSTGGDEDLCSWVEEMVVYGSLKPASHFQQCLDSAEDMERFGCLSNAIAEQLETCSEGALECGEGW